MDVVVAGGGVAGAACAIALRRIGARVTVYEAYEDPVGQVGSFVSLAGNGLRGLERLGCLEAVQRAGFPVARQRMWASSGKLLGDVPRGRRSADDLHGMTLMRGELVRTLRAAASRGGARVVTGERVTGSVARGDGVRVTLEGGREIGADLLVGADGLWSPTRKILDPAAPAPVYAGICNVSGVARGLDLEPGVFNLVFAGAGAFLHVVAPGGAVWWSAQVNCAEEPDPTAVADLARLAECYRTERVPSSILRAATEVHRPTLSHVLAPARVWRDDRIALVGDAAHPVGAGQGASMAIEDAVVLARSLAAASTVPDALAAYERARRPRVAKVARMAEDNRDAKVAGPVKRSLNDLFMPFFIRHFYERATGWLYAYQP
ncbi:FAD-dependent monooxygenase [Streptosporangium soli]|nr:FAD-dependent monooxygenase [Streptosporangium sp. KLBMP 9127]